MSNLTRFARSGKWIGNVFNKLLGHTAAIVLHRKAKRRIGLRNVDLNERRARLDRILDNIQDVQRNFFHFHVIQLHS